jgi:hypothetical protein
MAKRKQLAIVFACDRCGKQQPKNKAKSSANWAVYDAGQRCECGGAFSPKVVDDVALAARESGKGE